MTTQAHPNLTDAPALVVFGRDATGKPHASSFTAAEADLATRMKRSCGGPLSKGDVEAEFAELSG
jgi:hypothetical protein